MQLRISFVISFMARCDLSCCMRWLHTYFSFALVKLQIRLSNAKKYRGIVRRSFSFPREHSTIYPSRKRYELFRLLGLSEVICSSLHPPVSVVQRAAALRRTKFVRVREMVSKQAHLMRYWWRIVEMSFIMSSSLYSLRSIFDVATTIT